MAPITSIHRTAADLRERAREVEVEAVKQLEGGGYEEWKAGVHEARRLRELARQSDRCDENRRLSVVAADRILTKAGR